MSWKGLNSKQPIVSALLVYTVISYISAVLAAFIHPFMVGRADLVNRYSICNIIYGVANHNSMTGYLYPQQLGHIQST